MVCLFVCVYVCMCMRIVYLCICMCTCMYVLSSDCEEVLYEIHRLDIVSMTLSLYFSVTIWVLKTESGLAPPWLQKVFSDHKVVFNRVFFGRRPAVDSDCYGASILVQLACSRVLVRANSYTGNFGCATPVFSHAAAWPRYRALIRKLTLETQRNTCYVCRHYHTNTKTQGQDRENIGTRAVSDLTVRHLNTVTQVTVTGWQPQSKGQNIVKPHTEVIAKQWHEHLLSIFYSIES